jgi:hypothetical protein
MKEMPGGVVSHHLVISHEIGLLLNTMVRSEGLKCKEHAQEVEFISVYHKCL